MQPFGSLADRPVTITWEVSTDAVDRPERMDVELSPEECRGVLEQIAEASPRILLITGDVIARPDLVDLISRANARGLWVAFRPTVRAGLLDFDFDVLRRAGLRSLSVDLGDARVQGANRRITKALAALTAARRARLSLQIKSSPPQLADLSRLSHLMKTLQPSEWRISLPVPGLRGRALDPAEAETLLRALSRLPAETGVPLGISDAPQSRRVAIQSRARPHSRRRRILPLNDGRGRLFVSHRGEIQPGRALTIAGGNVRRHHLLDVYREATIFRRLRAPELLKGKCGACGFRLICGGSRARAYAVTGDYLAADPSCAFETAAFGEAVGHPLYLP